jgi:hypothetical protein
VLGSSRIKIAERLNQRWLQLLVLDWRFSFLLLLLLFLLVVALLLPAKIWNRAPPGSAPEIRISTLDYLQAYALTRSARQAEQSGNNDLAIQVWSLAFANDPGSRQIASSYISALLRSQKRAELARALQLARWLRSRMRDSTSDGLLIAAAEKNQAWELVLETSRSLSLAADNRQSVLRALFRTRKFREARDLLNGMPEKEMSDVSEFYREALNCILTPGRDVLTCVTLREAFRSSTTDIEALEIYLITCGEKRNLSEFRGALNSFKQLTDRSLLYELFYARWLHQLGRHSEARAIVGELRPPNSAFETFRICELHVALGERSEALALLRRYCPEFSDSAQAWVLYARLLVQHPESDEARSFTVRIQQYRSVPALNAIAAAMTLYLEPSSRTVKDLKSCLATIPRHESEPAICFFAADAFMAGGHPESACDTLLGVEPDHLRNEDFYARLFAAAEASRNASLMRRAAERRYQLVPEDPLAISNHAAMLVICEEKPEEALALTALCRRAQPGSLPARINHAAALINAGLVGSADVILSEIDESNLPVSARNQFRFIRLKRAVKIRDREEAVRLAPLIDKSSLYSAQVGWLEKNAI